MRKHSPKTECVLFANVESLERSDTNLPHLHLIFHFALRINMTDSLLLSFALHTFIHEKSVVPLPLHAVRMLLRYESENSCCWYSHLVLLKHKATKRETEWMNCTIGMKCVWACGCVLVNVFVCVYFPHCWCYNRLSFTLFFCAWHSLSLTFYMGKPKSSYFCAVRIPFFNWNA